MVLGQGILLPATKRHPSGNEARRRGLALHYVLVASYYLTFCLLLAPERMRVGLGVGLAIGSRLLLFDVMLNTAAGMPAFHVGN